MSNTSLARRTVLQVFFDGVDISADLQKYLLNLSYTDNEEDEADDLQIKLHDRDDLWLESWLNSLLSAAAENVSEDEVDSESEYTSSYRVIAPNGVSVHDRAGEQYHKYGTLPYGSIIEVKSISGGWANFTYSLKNAYCRASYLQPIDAQKIRQSSTRTAGKGLKIQAVIKRRSWNGSNKEEILECGQFELDNVTAGGPPSTITLKCTSLPFRSSIRQTLKSKSWEGYTLHGIADEIASKNGLACIFLSDKDPLYERVEQYKTSDIAFLQKLCRDAGCSLKVSNNAVIIFNQAQYENKSLVRTITRGSTGGYIKYKLSTGENNTYTSCRVSYTLSDGSVISATVYAEGYDESSDKQQCLEIKQKVTSYSEAKQLAGKLLRLYNKYELTASFTLPGDTNLLAGCTVQLKGWGAWSGIYTIKQAKHKVDSSGYTTQINLRRALAAIDNTETSAYDSATSAGMFEDGDAVMCKSGVKNYSDGAPMPEWVQNAVLYVRAVEQNGAILLVSAEKSKPVYTGRVNAGDVYKTSG